MIFGYRHEAPGGQVRRVLPPESLAGCLTREDETSRDAGERDVWDTPYGRLAGVEIHARAVHSLAGGERKLILRADDRITILLIFLLAYALALIQYRGAGWKVLLAAAVLMSIGVVAGAAVAMRHGLLWLDVSYVLSAIWGLAPMLKGGALIQHQVRVRRRIVQARLQEAQAEAPEIAPARTHQVLISYSRKDAEVVRRIADGLEQRSLSVWIDERRIAHGARWLAQLQRILRTAESALLMMGPHGVGRWQEAEIEECLIEARERGMRVIPVLLPEGPDPGALPPFVRSLNALDARFGFLERHLDAMARAVRPDQPVRQRPAA